MDNFHVSILDVVIVKKSGMSEEIMFQLVSRRKTNGVSVKCTRSTLSYCEANFPHDYVVYIVY